MRLGILLLVSALAVGGCEFKSHENHAENVTEAEVRRANREIQVPKALVDELEHWYVTVERKRDPTRAGTDLELMGGLKRQLLDLELTLLPKSGDALEEGLHFRLPTGGGTVDFEDIVHGKGGSFWVKMGLAKHLDEVQGTRVFYLSEARRRTIKGEDIGAGCKRWAEMSSWFNRDHSHHKLDVYSFEQRYVSVLAGTWLFAVITPKELHLGTMTFTDSRYPYLLCSAKPSEARVKPLTSSKTRI